MAENNSSSARNKEPQPKRKNIFFIIIGCLLIIFIIFFAIGGGFGILKERIQRVVDSYKTQKALKQYEQALDQYYQVLAQDTYGGKTPQETLDMFINALEKGDIELAAKYFALDDNLSRKDAEDGLKRASDEGRIFTILEFLKNAKLDQSSFDPNNVAVFYISNEKGEMVHEIDFVFNEYSGVWKIKSM
ncbi:MAG TPA: hypothetical protein P5345_00760 [Candidatus Paceibacterota bacterium]|nr:hypothetical protein [Candidatus Paceibacterota bacterium]HRU33564.1 hypothetical protein [Candidatus Paceibacterota bacterium]